MNRERDIDAVKGITAALQQNQNTGLKLSRTQNLRGSGHISRARRQSLGRSFNQSTLAQDGRTKADKCRQSLGGYNIDLGSSSRHPSRVTKNSTVILSPNEQDISRTASPAPYERRLISHRLLEESRDSCILQNRNLIPRPPKLEKGGDSCKTLSAKSEGSLKTLSTASESDFGHSSLSSFLSRGEDDEGEDDGNKSDTCVRVPSGVETGLPLTTIEQNAHSLSSFPPKYLPSDDHFLVVKPGRRRSMSLPRRKRTSLTGNKTLPKAQSRSAFARTTGSADESRPQPDPSPNLEATRRASVSSDDQSLSNIGGLRRGSTSSSAHRPRRPSQPAARGLGKTLSSDDDPCAPKRRASSGKEDNEKTKSKERRHKQQPSSALCTQSRPERKSRRPSKRRAVHDDERAAMGSVSKNDGSASFVEWGHLSAACQDIMEKWAEIKEKL
jgi:hypothetical protein